MPSKQSRNVKVQSRPVSSSVSDEQTFHEWIVSQLNDITEFIHIQKETNEFTPYSTIFQIQEVVREITIRENGGQYI